MPKQINITKGRSKDWRVLEFYMPIEESLTSGDDFVIKGVAINETTTLNNVKYVSEELQKAAISFRNVPILIDHVNEIGSIVGRTTNNVSFNSGAKRIEYEAKIMDEKIKEMIRDGRIQNVSIGAKVEDLLEEDDGSMKAIGIHGLEISLVAVPGDNQASLAQAIQHSFKLKEMAMKENAEEELDNQLNNNGGEEMTEEEKPEEVIAEPTEEVAATKEVEAPAETVEAEAAEKTQVTNVNVDMTEVSEMRKQLNEMKEMLMEKKKIKEEVEVEVKAEAEVADETVGEVSDESEEVAVDEKAAGMVLEQARSGYALYRDYSKEDANTKLHRLVR